MNINTSIKVPSSLVSLKILIQNKAIEANPNSLYVSKPRKMFKKAMC